MPRIMIAIACASLLLSSCSTANATPSAYPTYDPFLPLNGSAPIAAGTAFVENAPTRTPGPTPTRVSLSVMLPPTTDLRTPIATATPDSPHLVPTPRGSADQYVVQPGDTLSKIAQGYGISANALMQANGIADPNMISVGMTLKIPAAEPGAEGSSFKIIPDSELVYGPPSAIFDLNGFIQSKGGTLADYSQDINGETLPADQIITQVSQDYSVNPRLLLALIEYESKWVTKKNATVTDYPLGLVDANHIGLYHQLTWAANNLNLGYYRWRANAASSWVLGDGSIVPVAPTINAGTAGVQNFFAQLDDRTHWEEEIGPLGLFKTYFLLFGNPFDYSINPWPPPALAQPRMDLPFAAGETWSFTGGPHGGWDEGSAWAALDFAPPGDNGGCAVSESWVTAVANGIIVRASNGAVIEDLDNDGYEQTGWDVLYMHIASDGRVEPGTYVYSGDRIGHPSCEGGLANGTHVHLARKYNGEWIAADGSIAFNLDGWISSGTGTEYDGYLTRGSQKVEAWDGLNEINQIAH